MPTKHVQRTAAMREQFAADMQRLRQRLELKQRLAQARYRRTLARTVVLAMLREGLRPAVEIDARLPGWWPALGEQLKLRVRGLARRAGEVRELERAVERGGQAPGGGPGGGRE